MNTKATVDDPGGVFNDELKPGTTLLRGQYVIEEFLNSGGFGMTYLASDSLERTVVIKECFPATFCTRENNVVRARARDQQSDFRAVVRLFLREARQLAKLDHPNIVGVHQVFEDNETAYMALDCIEGKDLLDIIEDRTHPMPPERVRTILMKLLGAVSFVHEQGILHRDISPDNILLDGQGEPTLIDFGAAREKASKASRALSALMVVKDGYSPQEFYIAGSEQGPPSDLYSLAATFHHVITGEAPPNSQTRLAAVASDEPDPYQSLISRARGYDDTFLLAIDKALSLFPGERFQSAEEWLNEIDTEQKVAVALAQAKRDRRIDRTISELVRETNRAVDEAIRREAKQKTGAARPEQKERKAPKKVRYYTLSPDWKFDDDDSSDCDGAGAGARGVSSSLIPANQERKIPERINYISKLRAERERRLAGGATAPAESGARVRDAVAGTFSTPDKVATRLRDHTSLVGGQSGRFSFWKRFRRVSKWRLRTPEKSENKHPGRAAQ